MKRHTYLLGVVLTTFILGVVAFTASAQPDDSAETTPTCEVDFVEIIGEVEQFCTGVGRDQICYGNLSVNAIPRQDEVSLNFAQPGDSTDVSLIRSLYLSALDETQGTWGIAQMNLLANLSQQSPQDVILILFGDVQVDASVADREPLDLVVNPDYSARIRNTPVLNSLVIDVAEPNEVVHAVGRLADSSWVRIQEDQYGRVGWVSAQLLQTSGVDIESLPIDEADSPYFGSMQAIYFQNGTSPSCGNSISDGLIIQTPEGVGRLSLLINEVTIEMLGSNYGATAFVEASPDDGMAVSLLRGGANITANNQTVYVDMNETVRIPLSDDLSPLAPPSQPSASDADLGQRIVMMQYINSLFPIRTTTAGSNGVGVNGSSLAGGAGDSGPCDFNDGNWCNNGSADKGCVDEAGNSIPGNACKSQEQDPSGSPSANNNPPGQSNGTDNNSGGNGNANGSANSHKP